MRYRQWRKATKRGEDPTSLSDFQLRLEAIRRMGLAHTRDFIPGISGMAAPVFGSDGAMAVALVALGHSASFERQRGGIQERLLDCARRVSQRLGAPTDSG